MELRHENIYKKIDVPEGGLDVPPRDRDTIEKEIWDVFKENKKAFAGGDSARNMQLGAKFQELEQELKKAKGSWAELKKRKEIEMWDKIEEKRRNNGQNGNGNGHA